MKRRSLEEEEAEAGNLDWSLGLGSIERKLGIWAGVEGCLWSWGSREEASGTAAQPPSDLLPGILLAKPNRKSEGREPRDAMSVHRSASWSTEQVEKDGQ